MAKKAVDLGERAAAHYLQTTIREDLHAVEEGLVQLSPLLRRRRKVGPGAVR